MQYRRRTYPVEQLIECDTRFDIGVQYFAGIAQCATDSERAQGIGFITEFGLLEQHCEALFDGKQFARTAILGIGDKVVDGEIFFDLIHADQGQLAVGGCGQAAHAGSRRFHGVAQTAVQILQERRLNLAALQA